MTSLPDIDVLTWDPVCQRSTSIAQRIGRPLQTIHYLWYRRPWVAPVKYALQAAKTFTWLGERRPHVTLVSNPPPFAAFCVWLHCAYTGASFVLDAHTGVFLEPKWRTFLPLNRFLMRRALLTLVTNEALRQRVQGWNTAAFVLPDPLPDLGDYGELFPIDRQRFNVAAVFSFYEDEPVEEMLAVHNLPADMHVYITGDHRRLRSGLRRGLSPQITLTGFVPRPSYESLLRQCDAVLVLCTKPHTLLCGAYEAVAAGKPLLTSESADMRAYFRAGTLFIANSTAAIEAGLCAMRARHAELAAEMCDLRAALQESWERMFAHCLEIIAAGTAASSAAAANIVGL